MLQITPQMKILVAVEPVDFRRGIDGLAQLCKQKLGENPFSGTVFVFRNRRGTALKALVYDGQGFWLCHKRLSQGRFRWWPSADPSVDPSVDPSIDPAVDPVVGEEGEASPNLQAAKRLAAHQLAVLLSAGNPDHTAAAPDWRPVGPSV